MILAQKIKRNINITKISKYEKNQSFKSILQNLSNVFCTKIFRPKYQKSVYESRSARRCRQLPMTIHGLLFLATLDQLSYEFLIAAQKKIGKFIKILATCFSSWVALLVIGFGAECENKAPL